MAEMEAKRNIIPTTEAVGNLAYGLEGRVTEEFEGGVYVELPSTLAYCTFYVIGTRWGWDVQPTHSVSDHNGPVVTMVKTA